MNCLFACDALPDVCLCYYLYLIIQCARIVHLQLCLMHDIRGNILLTVIVYCFLIVIDSTCTLIIYVYYIALIIIIIIIILIMYQLSQL